MRILLITGDHNRHIYFANFINKNFGVEGIIIEKRESIIPSFDNIKNKIDKNNAEKHFNNRLNYEKFYFNNDKFEIDNQILLSDINKNNTSVEFVKTVNPDIVVLFGVNIVKEKLLSYLPNFTINLHSGLAPYYKGSACNFWPFYHLSPNLCGCTFHYVTKKLDSGNVIHHTLPDLEMGDTIHEVSCKLLLKACKDAVNIIDYFKIKKNIEGVAIKNQGKLFLNSDFTVEKLRLIYSLFNDDIVDHFLNANLPINNLKTIKLV